tara:strand:+ start:251 stop:1024 length:774 start_codon:yes stop_codon:yes gene_type:complete
MIGIKAMAAVLSNFEVRVLGKGKWTVESRGMDREQALTEANGLAGNRRHDGVKVVEETYDEEEGLFREKTIFSYFDQEEKVRTGERIAEAMAAARADRETGGRMPAYIADKKSTGSDFRGWMLILALVLGLGGNVGLALLIGDKLDIDMQSVTAEWQSDRKVAVYDLPEITANINSGDGERVLHIRVGLELGNGEKTGDVEKRLSDIVTRVSADLNRIDTGEQQLDIQDLRDRLKKGVQAAGETEIEGILFKEVLVF